MIFWIFLGLTIVADEPEEPRAIEGMIPEVSPLAPAERERYT